MSNTNGVIILLAMCRIYHNIVVKMYHALARFSIL